MESKTGSPEGNSERTLRLSLDPGVDAPARARRAPASFADGSTDPALGFALELVASGLVKNAVLYEDRTRKRSFLELAPATTARRSRLRVTNRVSVST